MDFSLEFPMNSELVYLNHAAVAPWPKRTQQAVTKFAQENTQMGAANYPKWLETESHLREQLKNLINASSTKEIALLKNTSEALSVVAYGLNWQPGDEIIISDTEFPSNRIVWESLEPRFGVKVVQVSLDGSQPEQNIIKSISANTKLVSISSTQYASGLTLQLKEIGAHCRQHGVLFCIDAIQTIGALPFDVQDIYADFAMADGHKWMLGPEGLALFYCREALLQKLSLNQFGWHMVKAAGDYTAVTWTAAEDAKRFECGSPNMLGAHALSASLSLILEVGIETIAKQIQFNVELLKNELLKIPNLSLIGYDSDCYHGGIISFFIDGKESAELYRALMNNHVICANRGGGIRFSPHFYHSEENLMSGIAVLKRLLNETA